jgi:hypothetical protein
MRPGPREGFHWTSELIVYAIELWHRQHLRTPTTDEWDRAGPNHPSRVSVIRRFGSWNAAMAAAGFRPARRANGERRASVGVAPTPAGSFLFSRS